MGTDGDDMAINAVKPIGRATWWLAFFACVGRWCGGNRDMNIYKPGNGVGGHCV